MTRWGRKIREKEGIVPSRFEWTFVLRSCVVLMNLTRFPPPHDI